MPQPDPADALRVLTLPEAAEATGLTVRALRHLVATRRVPVVRLGRSVRIRQSDLAAVLDAATTPARAEAA